MRNFSPVLSRFALLLLSIGALTLVGCLQRSALEGDPPLTLQAPTLPTLQPSATPPEPTTIAPITDPIIVSATATSIIPAVTSTSVGQSGQLEQPDGSAGVVNTGDVSGTAETLVIPPTRTQSPQEVLSATLQALTALNNPPTPTPLTTTVSISTPTITSPLVTVTPLTATNGTSAPDIVATTPVTTTSATETPTAPTTTPVPTVPTATPIPVVTITPFPDKSNLYVVKEGETLESIGTEWGVPTLELATANALPITAVLTPGQPIVIPIDKIIIPTPTLFIVTVTPTPSATTTATITTTETTTPTVDVTVTVEATAVPTPETAAPLPDSSFNPNDFFIHVVASGETIYSIATRFGFTEDELIAYNQLEYNNLSDNYLIYPGDELKIPRR